MVKVRIDKLLLDRGLVDDLILARSLLMAGQVRVNTQVILNSATLVDSQASITIDRGPRFVSRGGEKLVAAIQSFNVTPSGLACADIGASTGGFTDCLLTHGAKRVYAIDVGHGILDWKLRQDPRVVVMEGTNARYLIRLPEPVRLVTIDASFISLRVLLPVVKGWLDSSGEVIALIKPQFEANRAQAARSKGVIRDPLIHREVLVEFLHHAQLIGYEPRAIIRSPLVGPKGNVEFLAYLGFPAQTLSKIDDLLAGVF